MREIVGAMIDGGTITNNRKVIIDAVERGSIQQWYDRRHMQIMAACDLGLNWEKMAVGPTLFCIGDDGKPYAPSANSN